MTKYQIFGNRRGVLTAYETYPSVFEAMDVVDLLYVAEVHWPDGVPPIGLEWSRIEDNGLLTNAFTAFDGTCTTQWFVVEVNIAETTIGELGQMSMSNRYTGMTSGVVSEDVVRAGSARKKKEVSND